MKYLILVPNIEYDFCQSIEYYTTDDEKEAQDLSIAMDGFYYPLEKRSPPKTYDLYTASISLTTDWFTINHTKSLNNTKEKIDIPKIKEYELNHCECLMINAISDNSDILEKIKNEKEKLLAKQPIISIYEYFNIPVIQGYISQEFLDKNNGIIEINKYGIKYRLNFNNKTAEVLKEKYFLDGKEVIPTMSGLNYQVEKNWIKL